MQEQKVTPLRGDLEGSIAQMIIRYGEKEMCTIEDENGQEVPLSVAEYISYSLQDDDIQLQTPVYRQMLEEAVERAHTPNFHAEQYFNNHPDEQIRELALKLGTDAVELSRMFNEAPQTDERPKEEVSQEIEGDIRLDEVVPNLIASYKLGIVQHSLQSIIEQMKQPDIKEDREAYRQLLEEFNYKTKLAKELAKQCGERVVLK